MKSTAMSRARTCNSGLAAFGISTLLLVSAPAALADPCSGIQSDAVFLKATIESTIRETYADLFFQRQEDEETQKFTSECGGREDGTPKCRSIAINLAALKPLREEKQTKIQKAAQALTYYRQSYDKVNADLLQCWKLQAASGAPAAAPSDAPPPSDSTDWQQEAAAQQQYYGPPAGAALPPYDPSVDLSPINPLGVPAVRGPSRLNAPAVRITNLGPGQPDPSAAPPTPEPNRWDNPAPPRITKLDPRLPDPRKAPKTGVDSLEGALSNPVINGACDWARNQSNLDDIAQWQQTIQQIQEAAETRGQQLWEGWNAIQEEAESSRSGAMVALLLHREDPRLQSLVASDQSLVDEYDQDVQAALDGLNEVDLQISILHKRIAKATQCLDARKKELDPNSGQQASTGGEPGPAGSGQGGANSGGGGPPTRQGGAGPGAPPQPLPPPTIPVSAPPKSAPPQPLPPVTVPSSPPPSQPTAESCNQFCIVGTTHPSSTAPGIVNWLSISEITPTYRPSNLKILRCFSTEPAAELALCHDWRSAPKVKTPPDDDDWIQLRSIYGGTYTDMRLDSNGDCDQAEKAAASASQPASASCPANPPLRDVLQVAPLPPMVVATPQVDILEPAALPAPQPNVCHPVTPAPAAKPRQAATLRVAKRQATPSHEDPAPAQSINPEAAAAIMSIVGGMLGGGGYRGGGGGMNPCHH
jgi:hypothetical protein